MRAQIKVKDKKVEAVKAETEEKFTPFTPAELEKMGVGPEFNDLFDEDGNFKED